MNDSDLMFGVSDFSTSQPLDNAREIIASGMQFIEPGLAKIAAMPEPDFLAAVARLQQDQIRVCSVNWFLPPHIKITGPDVDSRVIQQFLACAIKRAVTLGARAIVFGSPGSRTVPAGFSLDKARQQMITFCHQCADLIEENQWDIRIAVEHVNHTETNFINTFSQAFEVVREVARPQVGLAADFYHFEMEKESTAIILEAADLIYAVQLADPSGRSFPKPDDAIQRLDTFFNHLIAAEYCGGVAVEANVNDLASDCRGAFEHLSSLSGRTIG